MDEELAKVESARQRLAELISELKDSIPDDYGDGSFSHADFDELEMIVAFLNTNLPERFHAILDGSGYIAGQENQYVLGQRLERVLAVDSAFPTNVSSAATDALLPTFELEQSDKERVMQLCDQMRKIVFGSEVFDEPHKRRLLNRIAGIEKQVLQPKGMLDVVLAGVSDVGEATGKFGKDIKPLTDRMREIAGIARKGSAEYRQIPAPDEIKSLPSPGESDEE